MEKFILNVKNFPKDLHRRAKIQAAIMEISLKDLIIKSMEDFLAKCKEEV